MQKTIGLGVLLLMIVSAGLQAQFARLYGGKGNDYPEQILPTLDGGFIVCGWSDSFSGAWVIKLAADGSVQWQKAYGESSHYEFLSVCQTAEGGYLMAGTLASGDAWLLKINNRGDIEWQKSIGGTQDDGASAVVQASDSGYYVVGYTKSFGAGDYDVWVIKFSPQGNMIWQKAYGGSGMDKAESPSIGPRAEPTSDGGCVVASSTKSFGSGGNDVMIFKIDSSGSVLWQKAIGSANNEQVFSMHKANDGGFVLAGIADQGISSCGDALVLKLGTNGGLEWAKSYGLSGSNSSCANAVDVWSNLDGSHVVAGWSQENDINGNILVMKLRGNGDIEWQKTFGGPFREYGYAVAQTTEGDFVAAGMTESFGAGYQDFCVLRILPNGYLGSCRFSKDSHLTAAARDVNQVDIALYVQDTSAVLQTTNFKGTDTSGGSQTYQLCSSKKLLTILPSGFPTQDPTPGTTLYDPGTLVTIQATQKFSAGQSSTYSFSHWEGDVSGSSNPLTFTIYDDTSVKAVYAQDLDWGGGGGGGAIGKPCFIATAAYKSPLHPAVRLLRDFRDKRLLTNGPGRAFVSSYYQWSPATARIISRSAPLRFVVRIFLLPIIGAAAFILGVGWPAGLAVWGGGLGMAIRKIRLGRGRKKKKTREFGKRLKGPEKSLGHRIERGAKMKIKILFLSVLLMFAAAAGPLAGQWAKSFHYSERDVANSIAQTSDGGCIIAGSSGWATLQDQKAILIKLNPKGNIEWQRSYAGSNLAEAKAVQQTFDGGYIIAGTYGTYQLVSQNIWVAKLSSSGTIEWQQLFGGSDAEDVSSIQQTLDGGYILSGSTGSFGAGKTDFWLMKLLPNGAIEWQKTYGGADSETAGSALQTADGGYILAGLSLSLSQSGIWVAKIQANGMVEWQIAFQATPIGNVAIQPSSEGGYVLAGNCQGGIFILKLSFRGTVEWQKGFKAPQKNGLSSNSSAVAGLCQTLDNGFVVAAHNFYNFGQGSFWAVKVNRQGALAWERAFQGSANDGAACLRQAFDDSLLLAASTEAFSSNAKIGNSDMLVMKLFPQGDLNAVCGLAVEAGNETLEPNIQSLDVNFQPQNSSAGPTAADIAIGNPNAEVHDFCTGKFFLSIKNANLSLGTTDPAPGLYAYDPGSLVSIKAVPAGQANKFNSWWIDGRNDLSNPLIVTMGSHQMVEAFFASTTWGGGGGGGSGSRSLCFIATAAYKSPLHPAVRLLRDFRDKRLLTNGLGRAFVSSYYKWSPATARIISRSALLRFVVRIFLLPIIGAAALILGLGWPAGLAVSVGGLAIAIKKIRLGRGRKKNK
jgi:hypothetical protein